MDIYIDDWEEHVWACRENALLEAEGWWECGASAYHNPTAFESAQEWEDELDLCDRMVTWFEMLYRAAKEAKENLMDWLYADDGRDYIPSGKCPACGLAYFDWPEECECPTGPYFAERETGSVWPQSHKMRPIVAATADHLRVVIAETNDETVVEQAKCLLETMSDQLAIAF